jgi:lysozyme
MTQLLGIDVSHWQGKMDWKRSKEAGVQFAFIKATEGLNHVDTQFKANVDGCGEAGIPYVIYHFWHNNVETDAQFANIARAYEYAKCPIALDVEMFAANLLPTQNAKLIVDLVNGIQRNMKMLPTIYTSASKWNAQIAQFTKWKELPLWVANYEVSQPLLPRDWNDWMVWQYKSKGNGAKFGAESQFIDLNYVKPEYLKYYGIGVAEPEPQPQEYDITITLDGVTYSGKVTKG